MMKISWSILGTLAAVLVIVALVAIPTQGVQTGGAVIPTAHVMEGDVPVVVHATGELRPVRSAGLVAPAIGGPLQILHIMGTGTPVKAGDVVVEFDLSEQTERLAQARSELEQAEQEITKLRADIVVQQAQDQVTLLTARFDVRRAELDAQANEMLSAVDAKKNLLTLEEAKRRLAQFETDLPSRDATNHASIAVAEEKRNKARLMMETAQRNIDNMRIRAPFDGLVAVKDNDSVGAAWTGVVVPEYRAGDTVYPGRPVAEVLHESGLELLARVTEYDRAHLVAGQKAEVAIHAVQGDALPATIKSVAGASRRSDFFGWDSTRMFDVNLQVSGNAAYLRPGLTTEVQVKGDPIKGARYLPRQALFEQDGKPVVFVRRGRSFEPREVKVSDRTESHVVVDLPVGTEVALRNPLSEDRRSGSSSGPVKPGSGS